MKQALSFMATSVSFQKFDWVWNKNTTKTYPIMFCIYIYDAEIWLFSCQKLTRSRKNGKISTLWHNKTLNGGIQLSGECNSNSWETSMKWEWKEQPTAVLSSQSGVVTCREWVPAHSTWAEEAHSQKKKRYSLFLVVRLFFNGWRSLMEQGEL